ncbi:bifunctional DNA-formamidopyrimidine glycosylase/DNA-(apurinic or apyrimidinic site) lyase [Hoyosella sp. G463]|uniref:Formamidopyrimidine-DNA glycosylase n=1 Tax=Lolliginicoccus lacisalsi TaxID=2742202 RepID=A0A927JEL2_9ACTN|nr:bifunctional DNA-formamidopyrimidine glycosylase/DNA-(apurinic or apyrimidinic site) lyase [Lolliginicoccus lacisalsi]MBD8507601.1 bifunctional DNA-formamidopyrimidine glycosylase/DNA-(apurinic or apyrimidinic site) lyase [Lolliginicoccus lacisalsi]
MPELPEVEVVRRGLERHVVPSRIVGIDVLHDRAVRRHVPGAGDLAGRLRGRMIRGARRRGKYLWLDVAEGNHPAPSRSGPGAPEAGDPGECIVVHLGMSGQMLVQQPGAGREKHARIIAVLDTGVELRFVDQRTFGGWMLADLVDDGSGGTVPEPVRHIARDPLDPLWDRERTVEVMRSRTSAIKRVLLDQAVVSGIGNIYADEALWRAGVHGERTAAKLTRPRLRAVLGAARDVMVEALAQGGTSFDSLYVNVNGQSGYFSRSLDAYGRAGEPCRRCGAVMRRESFMNRSSFSCPVCQPRPRVRAVPGGVRRP